MRKTRAEIVLGYLKNLDQYLAKFSPKESTHLEKLITEAFSRILDLPFYSIDNENTKRRYRVTWQGSISSVTKAPPGPDGIAYCYGFYLIIEATRRLGANQWALEFSPAVRHCEDFCIRNGLKPSDVCAVLVCTELHKDTYRSIKSHPKSDYRLVPMEVSEVIKILETSILAFTMKHLDVRKILKKISKAVRKTSSLRNFKHRLNTEISNWQKDIFDDEKSAFTGVRSYEVMRKSSRRETALSDILRTLQKHPTVKEYFDILGESLDAELIEDSLRQQSLAYFVGSTYEPEDDLYAPVLQVDFKGRNNRLVKEIMRI